MIWRPANSVPRIRSSTQRTFWSVTIVWKPSPSRIATSCVGRGAPSGPTKWHGPVPGTRASTMPGRAPRGRVDDERRAARRVDLPCASVVHRVVRESVADLARFGVAHEHLVDDFVVAARARRVVRAVQHEVAPRDRGQRVRVLLGRAGTAPRAARRASPARVRPRRTPRCTSTRFEPTPISRFARAPGAQLARSR